MHRSFRTAWTTAAPEAYVWFLSTQRRRRARPLLSASHGVNSPLNRSLLLSTNQRFWQLRLTPSTTRVRQYLIFALFGGALIFLIQGTYLAFMQAHVPTWAALCMTPAYAAFFEAPLPLGGLLAMLLLRRWFAALAVAAGISIGAVCSTATRSSSRPHQASVQPVTSVKHAPCNRIQMTKLVFMLSKNLSLAELRPVPTDPLKLDGVHMCPYVSSEILSWARLSELTGVTPSWDWGYFNRRCMGRATLARLVAAEWARQFETLRGTPWPWASAYPLASQLRGAEVGQAFIRGAHASNHARAAYASCSRAGATTTLHSYISLHSPITGFSIDFALALVQPPLFWAPAKALRVNWD